MKLISFWLVAALVVAAFLQATIPRKPTKCDRINEERLHQVRLHHHAAPPITEFDSHQPVMPLPGQ